MKFTSKFVSKPSNWLLEQEQPFKCSVYKPVCEFHYELLKFTTNLQTSERSSKYLCEKLAEIECNGACLFLGNPEKHNFQNCEELPPECVKWPP